MDADTKLLIAWMISPTRATRYATEFMCDLQSRLSTRVQLTTDGHDAYMEAVEEAFAGDVDYAMLVKTNSKEELPEKHKYSPSRLLNITRIPSTGDPDVLHISTSYVERHNLTMRMSMRRFTRLTNGFSKTIRNHYYAQALFFTYYNFCRPHSSLGNLVTPAMAAGLTDRLFDISDLDDLIRQKSDGPPRNTPSRSIQYTG